MPISISVVVCSYNGHDRISDCLTALKNQSLPPSAFEVIVVDDASRVDISKMVRSFGFRFIQNTQNVGLAEARNIGWKAAKGKIIAFTDDDCIPNVDWLSTLAQIFRQHNVIAACGKVETAERANIIQRYIHWTKPLRPLEADVAYSRNVLFRLKLYFLRQLTILDHHRWEKPQPVASLIGANMSFLRTILEKAKGFDSAFRFGGEEEEFCYRLQKLKEPQEVLWYSPALIVHHKFEKDLWHSLRRHFFYGLGTNRLRQKFSERPPVVFPIPVLFVMGCICGVAVDLLIPTFLLLPLTLYPQWLTNLRQTRFEGLVFPHLQLLMESAFNLGVVKSVLLGKPNFKV